MFAKWNCRRIGALLVPYSENALGDLERKRVETHVARCVACREELALVSTMSNLLRANPPSVVAPAADLWSRIEAQITPPVLPTNPVPVRMGTENANQWRSFLLSFGSSGVGVAAVVTGILFVVNRQVPHTLPAAPNVSQPSVELAASKEIDIRFIAPRSRTSGAAVPAAAQLIPHADLRSSARLARAVAHPRLRMHPEESRENGITLSFIRERTPARVASTVTTAKPAIPLSLPLKAAPARIMDAASTTVVADSTTLNHMQPEASLAPDMSSARAYFDNIHTDYHSRTYRTVAVASLSADEVLVRTVPASASAGDMGATLRRQQSLFSYAR